MSKLTLMPGLNQLSYLRSGRTVSDSIRMPETLRPPDQQSWGHLMRV